MRISTHLNVLTYINVNDGTSVLVQRAAMMGEDYVVGNTHNYLMCFSSGIL